MHISVGDIPPIEQVLTLYDAVGWSAYTHDPAKLIRSLAGSHLVITTRDDDGTLVGLVRTVSDGESICYVQDILVHPEAQRRGIGRELMGEILKRYSHCMFIALSTDAATSLDALRSHPFYRSMGFQAHPDLGLAAFGYRP